MPSKKKKYNARFPAGRIKKIMQTDEEVGKVAQAVPVIISRTLELFVESLLKRAGQITSAKNAKTLTPSHMKQCILSESRFDFLKDLVKGIPDVSSVDDESGSVANTSTAKSPPYYNRFQFRRKSDGGVSKPSATTSQPCSTSQPYSLSQTYNISQPSSTSQPVLPRFYNEIEIGGDDSKKEEEEPAPVRTPVVQSTGQRANNKPHTISSYTEFIKSHTSTKSTPATTSTAPATEVTKPNYIVGEKRKLSSDEDDEEEDDDDLEENGYHRLEIVTKPCTVDEDYDA